tara:strand:- start:6043 stop:6336 length:294 start_codon:yes stop_codon:yes gene_type:complete
MTASDQHGGKTYKKRVGSRAQVWHKTAHHTKGGLTRKHLKKNKHGRIVSKKKSEKAKKANVLGKAGFKTKKGSFKLFKKSDGKKKSKKGGQDAEEDQ